MDDEKIKKILRKFENREAKILPALHAIQDEYGYIPQHAIKIMAEYFGKSPSEIYSTASFYAFFRLERDAKHIIRVCNGVVCHLKGADKVIDTITKELGISVGEVTSDGLFKLELTGCIGQCDNPPAMMIDSEVFTGLTPKKVIEILRRYRK